MKNKYHYSPPEFARLAGVSRQSVYKQMMGGLSEYVIEVGGKKRIKAEALDEYFPKRVDKQQTSHSVNETAPNDNEKTDTVNETVNQSQPETGKSTEGKEASTAEQFEIFNKTISILTDQIAIKDQQIKDLSARLQEAMMLMGRQQAISMKTVEEQPTIVKEPVEPEIHKEEKPPQKRSIWDFLRR